MLASFLINFFIVFTGLGEVRLLEVRVQLLRGLQGCTQLQGQWSVCWAGRDLQLEITAGEGLQDG